MLLKASFGSWLKFQYVPPLIKGNVKSFTKFFLNI